MINPRIPKIEAKMRMIVLLDVGQALPALYTTASGRWTITGTDVWK